MSKKTLLLVIFLVFSVALVMAAVDKKTGDESLKCPVSGKEFTKSDATPEYEYEGKTYYFCCEGCKDAFIKDPAKYIGNDVDAEHAHDAEDTHAAEHAHAEHAHAEHAVHDHQAHAEENGMAVDPVCGMKLKKEDAKFTHVHNDKTYYFCTEECKDKFVKAPGNYIRADEDIVTCPVSGESFKKSEFTESIDYEGKAYYFCCAGCKDKFEKNPEKYAKK
ncbi:MAG: YHS domain-containing protein [Candidatus Aminicenantaceae bacterium]